VLERAAQEKKPLVIWFPSDGESDAAVYGRDIAELSKSKAVFIKIPFNADREPSPWAESSVVPVTRLLSDNPSRDYGVAVGRSTLIIADGWGNEFFRPSTSSNARTLEGYIVKVDSLVEKANKKLEKNLEKALEAQKEGNRKEAIKHILRNFSEGLVGLPAIESTKTLYRTIMDDAAEEIEALKASKDTVGLKALARELRKTDLEKTAEEAISAVS
jgi:hypothetical protein